MRNLRPIINDYIYWFELIRDGKHNPVKRRVISISRNIRNRYVEYFLNFSNPDLINIQDSKFNINHFELLSLYAKTKPFIALKSKIKSIQSDRITKYYCQYCCIRKANSLDHYLPISTYPEFSVLSFNLLPCCKDCNGKKLDTWKINRERVILNFYVDPIPHLQFLKIKFSMDSNGEPSFYYYIDDTFLNPNVKDIVLNHFGRLELLEQYDVEGAEELDNICTRFYTDKPNLKIFTQASIMEMLKNHYLSFIKPLGINHWKTVLYNELSLSTQFADYIINI